MTELPELLNALNKAVYIDDDIRCEDNEDVIREYNNILTKYLSANMRTRKVYELLKQRYYIHDGGYQAFGFIDSYFYFLKDN